MGKKGKMPDMNLPIWFDGQNINEALFCEEFLHERRIIFANGAFFTPDGRVTDAAEQELLDLRARVKTLEENRITTENIYQFLLHFDKLYNMLTDVEKKAFLNSFVEEVHIFEEPQADGKFLKSIKFRFPIPYEGDSIRELSWDKSSTVEAVALLKRREDD